uniref:E3 UFM1-protein ligase 1 homolog n=1 Tax=Angiostrongylus cantonensis TaxID=6313 RepID=A0A0K0DFR7_ANGCA
MAATWEDIRRLVTDLQRVQLTQAAKKLSEANCVEVVSKLIQRSMIDVVFTRDGHSYITRNHLTTEVRNECVALGGRAPLTDIAAALNVDLDHVEHVALKLVSENIGFTISGGELFSEEYVVNLQAELRSLLAEHGHRTIAFLCKHWNLSNELLRSLLLDHISADFDGVIDGDSIFTLEYLEAHKNIFRALLSAITKPLPINAIQARVGLPLGRFWPTFDGLVAAGEVPGRLSGSRSSPSCTYIPQIHDVLVQTYVQNLFRQQEFIQTSVLKKLGLSETQLLRQGNDDFKIETLPSVLVSTAIFQQCLTAVKEAVRESDVCDVKLALQSFAVPFDDEDFLLISESVSTLEKDLHNADGYVFSDKTLARAMERLDDHIDAWALSDALRADLSQFILRTVGTELANLILSYASGTESTSLSKEKQRDETIASLPAELRDAISTVFISLRGNDLDAFHSAVFNLSSPMTFSFVLKQPDAKARAETLNTYVSELKEQAMSESEPAAKLLSCVLFLLAKHEKPVTASGRFVAQLVLQLEGLSTFDLLVSCQRLVVQCLKYKDDEEAKAMLTSDIEKLKQKVIV